MMMRLRVCNWLLSKTRKFLRIAQGVWEYVRRRLNTSNKEGTQKSQEQASNFLKTQNEVDVPLPPTLPGVAKALDKHTYKMGWRRHAPGKGADTFQICGLVT